MQNCALNGAQFCMENNQICQTQDAFRNNPKITKFYCFGESITHHGTVIFCENGLVFAIDIGGNKEQNILFLRIKLSEWKPNEEEQVIEVSEIITFCELYDAAFECCQKFGKYDSTLKNCQTWNNNLIKIFKVQRRTMWSFITFGAIGAVVVAVTAVVAYATFPPRMTFV